MANVVLRSGGEGDTFPKDNKARDKSHQSRLYTQGVVVKSFSSNFSGGKQKHSVLHRLVGGHMKLQPKGEL